MKPNIKNKIPKIPSVAVSLIILLTGMLVSSIFINLETNTELKKIATSSEEHSTTDRVIGKKTINLPILPGHNPSGIKAATVVAVEIIIGKAISEIPFFVASILFMPSFSINL